MVREISFNRAKALKQAPFEAAWKKRSGIVRHGFTHFELETEVYVDGCDRSGPKFTRRLGACAKSCAKLPCRQ